MLKGVLVDLKRKTSPGLVNKKELKNVKQTEGHLSPAHTKDSLLSLEYWSNQIAEARAAMARALNIDNSVEKEGLMSPTYIEDPLLLLEYWVARSGEARARMEERLALASLNAKMDIALR